MWNTVKIPLPKIWRLYVPKQGVRAEDVDGVEAFNGTEGTVESSTEPYTGTTMTMGIYWVWIDEFVLFDNTWSR